MHKIREVIVVEGRYDKNAVSQAVDAVIIETAGFGIFSRKETVQLLRRIAHERGLIILTDSDSAGFLIRNHLKGQLNDVPVKQAYIPDVMGVERRKSAPSKEGKIGVEGMPAEVIVQALRRCGATFDDEECGAEREITKTDLYELGLSGRPDSAARRKLLLRELQLPERLSANALVDVLNVLYSREALLSIAGKLFLQDCGEDRADQ